MTKLLSPDADFDTLADFAVTKSLVPFIDLQWFAAEDEGRTEDATEHKLRKAREEGRVAKSQELNGAFVMLLAVVTLIALAPWIFKNCVDIIRFYFLRAVSSELTDRALLSAFFGFFIKTILPIMLTVVIGGIVANIIQNRGFIFSTKPIEFKFSKIVPRFGDYLRKTLFSFEGFFNTAKSIFKVVIVFIAAFWVIRNDLPQLLSLIHANLWNGFTHIAYMAGKLLVIAAFIFLAVSIPDYLVQRRQFMESMKMTKQDIKEEYKNLEGDPLVKSRLRQRMREMLSQNMPRAVAQADVIITNPTHYACAILYDKSTMQGPMLTAKGVDSIAQRMKEIARENEIPIIENKPLARAIYAEVAIGDMIPETYYQALALILGKVYSLNARKPKTKWL